ncbi:hypothetical protein C8R47DRAFT_571498 [Mycena vitilis]|nr:hypothetical protein C8R47DRAFT_571498 [Mycena vitilis]
MGRGGGTIARRTEGVCLYLIYVVLLPSPTLCPLRHVASGSRPIHSLRFPPCQSLSIGVYRPFPSSPPPRCLSMSFLTRRSPRAACFLAFPCPRVPSSRFLPFPSSSASPQYLITIPTDAAILIVPSGRRCLPARSRIPWLISLPSCSPGRIRTTERYRRRSLTKLEGSSHA